MAPFSACAETLGPAADETPGTTSASSAAPEAATAAFFATEFIDFPPRIRCRRPLSRAARRRPCPTRVERGHICENVTAICRCCRDEVERRPGRSDPHARDHEPAPQDHALAA